MIKRISSCFVLFLWLLMIAASGFAETTLINVYDASGNLVSGDGQYYEYNDANQLVKVRQGDQNGTVVAEYFYDSTGQRVKKIENGVVTYYVGKHFEKQVGGSNAGSTSYYFAEGGERVAKKDPSGGVYYYHLDHLGGVNVVTNAAGTEVARSDYLPFGDTRSDSTGADKYSYTGKEKDKTDLYYFEARYNSPANRHFTQADMADPDYDDPQDLNRYAYVGNNPLSYVDYDGFKKKKKAKLSKREKWMIAHGRDPDKDKTSLKKAKKQEKNKSKLSDREEWMIAHGYDPDKDKTSLKQAKKREEEKQRALAALARQNPASSVQGGAGHSLVVSGSNKGMVLGDSIEIPTCDASNPLCKLHIARIKSGHDQHKAASELDRIIAGLEIVKTMACHIHIAGSVCGLYDIVDIDQQDILYDATDGVMGKKSSWSDYVNSLGITILENSVGLYK